MFILSIHNILCRLFVLPAYRANISCKTLFPSFMNETDLIDRKFHNINHQTYPAEIRSDYDEKSTTPPNSNLMIYDSENGGSIGSDGGGGLVIGDHNGNTTTVKYNQHVIAAKTQFLNGNTSPPTGLSLNLDLGRKNLTFNSDQVQCLCEALLQSGDVEKLTTFLWSLPHNDLYRTDESVLR